MKNSGIVERLNIAKTAWTDFAETCGKKSVDGGHRK